MAGLQESGLENKMQENVLEKRMQKCCLNQDCSLIKITENKKENECQLINQEPQTVEEKKMVDMFNELDDEEDDLEKIAEQTYKILIESSKNTAIKIIEECQADGSTNFSPEKVKEKILWMTNVIYETKLNMLRDNLLKEE